MTVLLGSSLKNEAGEAGGADPSRRSGSGAGVTEYGMELGQEREEGSVGELGGGGHPAASACPPSSAVLSPWGWGRLGPRTLVNPSLAPADPRGPHLQGGLLLQQGRPGPRPRGTGWPFSQSWTRVASGGAGRQVSRALRRAGPRCGEGPAGKWYLSEGVTHQDRSEFVFLEFAPLVRCAAPSVSPQEGGSPGMPAPARRPRALSKSGAWGSSFIRGLPGGPGSLLLGQPPALPL